MSDLISRRDAIGTLKELEVVETDNFTRTDPISMMTAATIADCIEAIIELPPAESERKKGKWSNYKDEHCCSVCHCVVISECWDEEIKYEYCPYCGAEMTRAK